MLVTRVGGLHEVVQDGKTGFVTDPDPAAIAEGIVRFFEEPIPHLQQNLLEEKKKYSWDRFIDVLMQAGSLAKGG